jgi:hypothetical protein
MAKPHSFYQQIELTFKDETSQIIHLKYSFVLWTLRQVDQKYLGSSQMWCWRRMEMISWTDQMRNEVVLQRVKKETNILCTVK